jgi:hypothetical protein
MHFSRNLTIKLTIEFVSLPRQLPIILTGTPLLDFVVLTRPIPKVPGATKRGTRLELRIIQPQDYDLSECEDSSPISSMIQQTKSGYMPTRLDTRGLSHVIISRCSPLVLQGGLL